MKLYVFKNSEFEEWADKNPILEYGNQEKDIDFLDKHYDDIELEEGVAKDPRTRILNNRLDKTNDIVNIQKVKWENVYKNKYELYIYGQIFILEPYKIYEKTDNNLLNDFVMVVDRQSNPYNFCLGDFEIGVVYKEICTDGSVRFGYDFNCEININSPREDFEKKIALIVKIQCWFRKNRMSNIRKNAIMKGLIVKDWFDSPDNPISNKLRENWFHKGILLEIMC
jgi:hypothetical protein